jgi:hypothetical protein
VTERVIATSEVVEIELSVPDGHRHLRTRICLAGGEELVLQEATVASLVRAYIALKTHPALQRQRLTGRLLPDDERKAGFAAWQLLESD